MATLETLGENGRIELHAGDNDGDIAITDAEIRTHTLVLSAPAGTITQVSSETPVDEETPVAGSLLVAEAALEAESLAGIDLAHVWAVAIEAEVTGSGAIRIDNVGFVLDEEGAPVWPETVTLTEIRTAAGSITIETISEYLVIADVASLSGAEDRKSVV